MNNVNDISRLSYKELQALALRYRVPGNIKKKLLVRVLQAARCGNDNEVGRLLEDLRQNRRRRTKRMRPGRLGVTSTPLNSPTSTDMADEYYCPPQHSQNQWIGAEEEIVNRGEDDTARVPNYEEFKQFLLRRMQREYQVYDVNHNQVQDSGICVDLRTATATSDLQTIAMDPETYQRTSLIAVNNAESFVYQPIEHQQLEYQTLEEAGAERQGPKLLKKLLQAPVGANLGEIVSPDLNGYRFWSMDQCQAGNVELDNSDTLTAESENNEDEGNLDVNQEYYGFLTGIRGEYFLNEPAFVARNVEEIGQQMSTVLTADGNPQHPRYQPGASDSRGYENWTVTNVVDGSTETGYDVQSSRILQTMYYENPATEGLAKQQEDGLHCQYRVITDTPVHPYPSGQSLIGVNPGDEYYEPGIMAQVQNETGPTGYGLQNLVKYGETAGEYLQTGQNYPGGSDEQEAYGSSVSQTFSSGNHYDSAVHCEYTYNTQEAQSQSQLQLQPQLQLQQQTAALQENLEQQSASGSSVSKDQSERKETSSTGVLDPFWPKRSPRGEQDHLLENTLNLGNGKRIDLARLDQTSCVYCYIAPIVTHTASSPSSVCSQKERFVAEYRQHCFTPYWMIYNDAGSGLRLANNPRSWSVGDGVAEDSRMATAQSSGNSETKDTNGRCSGEDSMNWTSEYTNYDAVATKAVCEEMEVEGSEPLFQSAITDEPLVDAHVDDLSGNGAK